MNLIKKYDAKTAVLKEYKLWIRSAAKPVDTNSSYELRLVNDLSRIMNEFRKIYGWIGASSNNIIWNGSEKPMQVIQVPSIEGYLTLVNPKILDLGPACFKSYEGCAALPKKAFCIKRANYVRLETLIFRNKSFENIELEFSMEKDEQSTWVVQHELDHLEGIILSDKVKNR